jgi:hypothetical protein
MSTYTWNTNVELRTNKPLTENAIIIDLYDGNRFVVQAICPARPGDKLLSFLPDTVLHTQRIASLSQDELAKWRKRADYTPNEFCGPFGDVVFE